MEHTNTMELNPEPGITITIERRERPYYVYPKNGRAYLSHSWREHTRKTRVHVWPKNESVLENLVVRHSRPVREWGKVVRERVFPVLGMTGEKMSWSQKAGCSCGCSPAFVLDGYLFADGVKHGGGGGLDGVHDITVTIDFALLEIPTAVADTNSLGRAAQLAADDLMAKLMKAAV